jgi:hypothetical protein
VRAGSGHRACRFARLEPEEQLSWEARYGRLAAAAAFGSAVFAALSVGLQISLGARPDDEREALMRVDEDLGMLIVSLAAQAVSLILLTGGFLYLLRAAMARRPEVPRLVLPLLFVAPVLLSVGGFMNQLDVSEVADRFLESGPRSEDRAEDLLDDRSVVGGAIASGGTLCLALSFVFVSLYAMRAGLLSRFMGYLGMIVGGLLVLPLVPGGQVFIQVFWVFALGLLFLDRWPGGRGPAWERVESIPWPSAAQVRDAAALEERAAEATEEVEAESAEEALPERRKRKKKRRR